ncbi:Ankyrin [Wolbachia endosymbiont of Cylisticus convexus]|nr:Ankyrin [Wolbachia endosymbiont of Cylisticus convexus]
MGKFHWSTLLTSKDRNKKTNVNHKKIFGALEGVDIKQSKFVSKINNQKEINRKASPSRNIRENKINYGKSLDYIYGTKPLNDQAEDLNPFTSALKKIKPNTGESEKLSWFKSAILEAKNVNELHKTIDQVLASGARINACNDGEWSIAEYVVLGTHFHRLEKSDRKKLIRKLMLSGAEFHDTLLQNKLIGEIYNELQPEVQPQIEKKLEELEKAGESAVQEGSLIDLEIDNKTLFMEFSEDSAGQIKPVKPKRNFLAECMANFIYNFVEKSFLQL